VGRGREVSADRHVHRRSRVQRTDDPHPTPPDAAALPGWFRGLRHRRAALADRRATADGDSGRRLLARGLDALLGDGLGRASFLWGQCRLVGRRCVAGRPSDLLEPGTALDGISGKQRAARGAIEQGPDRGRAHPSCGRAGHFVQREQAQQRPRGERREQYQGQPGEQRGHAEGSGMVKRGAAESENGDDRELRQDQRHQQFDGSDRPYATRRPYQCGEEQRQHQHDDVDGGFANQQLQPQRERGRDGEQRDEERHERAQRGSSHGSGDHSGVCEERTVGMARCRGHDRRHLVRGTEQQHRDRRRHADRQHPQR
jgi:hypothetical protein